MNLFVGINNSGKSALLRALSYPLPDNPHKSLEDVGFAATRPPKVELKLRGPLNELWIRHKRTRTEPTFPALSHNNSTEGQQRLLNLLNNPPDAIELEAERNINSTLISSEGASIRELRDPTGQLALSVQFHDGSFRAVSRAGNPDNLPTFFDNEASESYFYFAPERVKVSRYQMAEEKRLRPDASNLPAVLAYAQSRRAPLFERIEAHMAEILPGIERITIAPREQTFEILLWPSRKSELNFSLAESGSGRRRNKHVPAFRRRS